MNQRNEIFSAWRFLFVVFIVGYHFAPEAQREGWWVFSTGQVCVTFFFVLSGFLAHQSSMRKWSGAADFLRAKFVALAPLYFAVLALAVVLDLASGVFRPGVILADAALVQAWIPGVQLALNGPAWFMSALFACFALYPLMRKLRGRSLTVAAVLLWVTVQAVCFFLGTEGRLERFSYWIYFPLFHASSFFLGVALAAAMEHRRSDAGSLFPTALGALVVLPALAMLPAAPPLIRQCAEISLFAPLFAFLVWSVVVAPRWLVEAADLPWLRIAGALSFPVYLLQMPVYKIYYQAAVKPFGGEMTWILFAAYLLILTAAAWIWLRYLAPMCGNVFRLPAMRRPGEQLPLGR